MANFNVSVTQSNEPQPSGIGAGDSTTYTISNPLPGSSYFTLETVKNSNGAYDSNSPKNLQGTLSGDSGITNIVSDDYKAGIVVSPGGGVLTFVPTNTITAATLRLRGTSTGFVSTTPTNLDADYQAILTKASELGYSAPSAAQQELQNTLVTDLKSAGVWDKLDALYVFATNGDSDYATLNWRSPSNNEADKVNSPTFTENRGFTGATTKYIDTNFQQDQGNKHKQNDASFGVYTWSDIASETQNFFSVDRSRGYTRLRKRGATSSNRLNASTDPSPLVRVSTLTTAQLCGIQRTSPTELHGLSGDSTFTTTGIATSVARDPDNFTVFKFGSSYSTGECGLAWIGGSFTLTEWGDYVTAVETYITAITP